MNFFKRTTTWSNTELWIFKVCVFSCGIIAGFLLHDHLCAYLPYVIFFSVVTVIWIGLLWVKKMRSEK